MKHHLLSSYDEFLLINSLPGEKHKIKASFNKANRVILINELLFSSFNSDNFSGKDYALPISMEFFSWKTSHSKKNLKNLRYYIDSLIGNDQLIYKLIKRENWIITQKISWTLKEKFEFF